MVFPSLYLKKVGFTPMIDELHDGAAAGPVTNQDDILRLGEPDDYQHLSRWTV